MNNEVTKFLNELNHPFRVEIEQLREIILGADSNLLENIKWNGPNYSYNNNDRITMRIQPPKQVQLIFHRGAKVKEKPKEKLVQDRSGLLIWKENDRAIVTFKSLADIERARQNLLEIIQDWIKVTT